MVCRWVPYAEAMPSLRRWTTKRAVARADGELVAELTDGPLSGSVRTVAAVEGRPPKTIDVEFDGGLLRYCLAEWEQSGHSATYGFLYEV